MSTVTTMNVSPTSSPERETGRVKWYSERKGYGFIEINDEEIFIHRSALLSFGVERLQNEDIVDVTIRQAERGLVVENLLSIERIPISAELFASEPESGEEMAEVKFFDEDKGYGFIIVDNYDDDIFVHSQILKQNGLTVLHTGQQLLVRVEDGDRGERVSTIRLFVDADDSSVYEN